MPHQSGPDARAEEAVNSAIACNRTLHDLDCHRRTGNQRMRNADWWEGLPPLERTRRAPIEHVWTMWNNGTRPMDCAIAHIDSVGHEARITDNGELHFSRVFPTRELPLAEAD
jgi:hypothetical protein